MANRKTQRLNPLKILIENSMLVAIARITIVRNTPPIFCPVEKYF